MSHLKINVILIVFLFLSLLFNNCVFNNFINPILVPSIVQYLSYTLKLL